MSPGETDQKRDRDSHPNSYLLVRPFLCNKCALCSIKNGIFGDMVPSWLDE